MPKATAIWLIDNTSLTFEQIADFCGLHILEVKGIADGEVANKMQGLNPITSKQLTKEEIERCQKDSKARLKLAEFSVPTVAKSNKRKYTPIAKRRDKPAAILWIVKHYPELADTQIAKLVGSTKNTVSAIRDRTHWDISNIRPRDPVLIGICTQTALNDLVQKAKIAAEKQKQKE